MRRSLATVGLVAVIATGVNASRGQDVNASRGQDPSRGQDLTRSDDGSATDRPDRSGDETGSSSGRVEAAPAPAIPWPPQLLISGDLREFPELAWNHSATFRDQCRQLGATRAVVIVQSSQRMLKAQARIGVAQNAAPEQEVVPATGGARAWAHGQSLPVSDPREILASDPAAFIQLLDDFRPSPVTSETKQMVLKSLPLELKDRAVNARDRAKLEGLYPVLCAVQRDAVYEIRVIESPSATIAIDGRAVLLISERALGVLDADQLRAAVAHEAAHEYVWEEWQRADKRDDWKRLRELELVCDGIAVVILQQLGLETSSLIRGFEKLTYLNLLWLGPPPNPSGYPTLAERREFASEVGAWMTGRSRKDASGRAGRLRR